MSKFEWKELPDWRNLADYDFLNDAGREVWAWEFLRRQPQYRRYWHRGRKALDFQVYRPKKKHLETEKQWALRVGYETGVKPYPVSLGAYWGKKWHLEHTYDPCLPYSQGVQFRRTEGHIPGMIFQPEEFLELLEDEELEDGSVFQRVNNRFAVVVFDLMRPIKEQGDSAQQMLFKWHEEMVDSGRIANYESHAGKSEKWKRHLRALDAARTKPRPTNAEIARVLNGDDVSPDYLRRKGERLLEAARNAMMEYQKVLKFKGTPGKNKNS